MLQKLFGRNQDKEISAHEVHEGIDSSAHTIVDVREPDEWAAGHIGSAIHIPLGQLEERAAEVPADKPVVTVCRSGGRSLAAVPILEQAGRTGTKSMAGGMTDWSRRGYPVR